MFVSLRECIIWILETPIKIFIGVLLQGGDSWEGTGAQYIL